MDDHVYLEANFFIFRVIEYVLHEIYYLITLSVR